MDDAALDRRTWKRLALLLVGAVAGFLLLTQGPLYDAFLALMHGVERVARGAGAFAPAAFVALAMISALMAPFSSLALVPGAVLAWGREPAFALLSLGWVLGSLGSYAIGRFAGERLLHRFIPHARIEVLTERIGAHRAFVAGTLARVVLPSEAGYAYGLVRWNFPQYVVMTLLAEIPVAALVVYGSDALLEKRGSWFVGILIIATLVLIATWLLVHLRRQRGGMSPRTKS